MKATAFEAEGLLTTAGLVRELNRVGQEVSEAVKRGNFNVQADPGSRYIEAIADLERRIVALESKI